MMTWDIFCCYKQYATYRELEWKYSYPEKYPKSFSHQSQQNEQNYIHIHRLDKHIHVAVAFHLHEVQILDVLDFGLMIGRYFSKETEWVSVSLF